MLRGCKVTPLSVVGAFTFTCEREAGEEFVELFDVFKTPVTALIPQVNTTRSNADSIRGPHISGFDKDVYCPIGRIYDMVIDMRPGSPTFGQSCGAWIDRNTAIHCPAFCAHAVFAGDDDSVICYIQGGHMWKGLDYVVSGKGLVTFPTPASGQYLISAQDRDAAPAPPAMLEEIARRINDPVGHRREFTNCDVLIFAPSLEVAQPGIDLVVEKYRYHFHSMSATERETFEAIVTSLRPKWGVVYVLQTGGVREVLNVAQVGALWQIPVAIVGDPIGEAALLLLPERPVFVPSVARGVQLVVFGDL